MQRVKYKTGDWSERGFTLVELLVVVSIIAVLLSATMAIFGEVKAKSRDAKRLTDMNQLQSALGLYSSSSGFYPICNPEVKINGSTDCFSSAMKTGDFLRTVPSDPLGGFVGSCGNGGDYVYCYFSGDGSSYTLRYNLETGSLESVGWHSRKL